MNRGKNILSYFTPAPPTSASPNATYGVASVSIAGLNTAIIVLSLRFGHEGYICAAIGFAFISSILGCYFGHEGLERSGKRDIVARVGHIWNVVILMCFTVILIGVVLIDMRLV